MTAKRKTAPVMNNGIVARRHYKRFTVKELKTEIRDGFNRVFYGDAESQLMLKGNQRFRVRTASAEPVVWIVASSETDAALHARKKSFQRWRWLRDGSWLQELMRRNEVHLSHAGTAPEHPHYELIQAAKSLFNYVYR